MRPFFKKARCTVRDKLIMILCIMTSIGALGGAYWYWENVYSTEYVPMAPLPSPIMSWTTVPTSQPERSSASAALPKNPRGNPKQLLVWRGNVIIISMYFGDTVYTSRGWGSPCGEVAYRDKEDWPKPGYLSESRSLITGHVWCEREVYALDNLGKVKAGDRAEIHYTSGDVVIGFAEHDAEDILKAALNEEKEGARNPNLRNPLSMRTFRVSTCDTDSTVRPDGHLSKNTYVPYAVTEIRYAL